MTIPLKWTIIYGPVNSRRLGRSLGINLLPTDYKLCTFNCLYCQYGWTKIHANHLPDKEAWPSVSNIALNPKLQYCPIPLLLPIQIFVVQ